ncbi:MAG: VacJ family lipoprotein [Alphaproteobacteria bacterium]
MPACRRFPVVSAITAALALVGCATAGTEPNPSPDQVAEVEFNDPLEELNRSIFRFNQVVDDVVLVPVSKGYRTAVPPPMRSSVHDFLRNLNSPVIFANDVFQGQPRLAAQTLARLTINTTVGVGGMFDVASRIGIPYHTNDMGITFATYGVDEGPYLVAPVLGPTNPRDLVGKIADSFLDPADYVAGAHDIWYAPLARTLVSGIDVRSRNIEALADIEKTSLDFYATIRSLFRQRRAAEIRHEDSNLPNPTISPSSEGRRNPAISPYYANPSNFREFSAK